MVFKEKYYCMIGSKVNLITSRGRTIFIEQLGWVSSGASAVNRRFTLVKLTEI